MFKTVGVVDSIWFDSEMRYGFVVISHPGQCTDLSIRIIEQQPDTPWHSPIDV